MKFDEFYRKITRQKEYTCKFCDASLPHINDVVQYKGNSFNHTDILNSYNLYNDLRELNDTPSDWVLMEYVKCPKCGKTSITLYRPMTEERIPIYPKHFGKVFPDYIPEPILKDYEEACLIMDLSPKASATLSRRCLQGIIRDFFDINNEDTLYNEIEKAAEQESITPQQRNALHALRKLGNIGAHPEKDVNFIVEVEPHEAATMIKLVEFFLTEWYIRRYESEKLLSDIVSINNQKQAIKQNPPPNPT